MHAVYNIYYEEIIGKIKFQILTSVITSNYRNQYNIVLILCIIIYTMYVYDELSIVYLQNKILYTYIYMVIYYNIK